MVSRPGPPSLASTSITAVVFSPVEALSAPVTGGRNGSICAPEVPIPLASVIVMTYTCPSGRVIVSTALSPFAALVIDALGSVLRKVPISS